MNPSEIESNGSERSSPAPEREESADITRKLGAQAEIYHPFARLPLKWEPSVLEPWE